MKAAFHIAMDVIREAMSRRWILALGVGATAVVVTLAAGLRLDVVDGALAATTFFGKTGGAHDIQAVDVALRPVFQAAGLVVFSLGQLLGILACADFAPTLLAPGRIEHLLSLPVSRASILAGVFAGVNLIMLALGLYVGCGVIVVLAVKTGVWMPALLLSVGLGAVAFGLIYAVMLIVSLWARSAALSAVIGVLTFAATVLGSFRKELLDVVDEGWAQTTFEGLTYVMPPAFSLAELAGTVGEGRTLDVALFAARLGGVAVFTIAVLALGVWRFEGRDF